jgi:hypothetical protein
MTIIWDLYQGAPEFKSGHASKVLGEIFRGFPQPQVESRDITRNDDTNASFHILSN